MRKQILRITAWVTACALCLFSFQGFAENGNSTVDIDVWMNILSDLSEKKTESPDENITYQTEPSDEYMPYQMTMDDIQALNPGSTVIDIYNNDGYLSLLVGKFYEGKVTNMEEGIESILGMATMLGFGKGCAFYCIYKSHNNNNGYTFYTYQQRYGGYTLRNATLRIAVDPEGYTAGLSCSFIPNVGTESQDPGPLRRQRVYRSGHCCPGQRCPGDTGRDIRGSNSCGEEKYPGQSPYRTSQLSSAGCAGAASKIPGQI